MFLDELFDEALYSVERGKKIFKTCIEGKRNPVVIVFCDDNPKLLKSAEKYYDKFITNYESIIILFNDLLVDKVKFCTRKNESIHVLNDNDINDILNFQLFLGSPALKCIALNVTQNVKLMNIIGVKGISMDGLVYHELYGMYGSE